MEKCLSANYNNLNFPKLQKYIIIITRGGAVEARQAHNLEVVRSNRTPATNPLSQTLQKVFHRP